MAVESVLEWRRGAYVISTDPARVDLAVVHGFLSRSYWAEGRTLDVVRRSLAGSLVFGLYEGQEQVGLARVVTDRATFAYLADVFVLPRRRGQGLGEWLVATVLAHPQLQGLRWLLATRDAHALYARHGFVPLDLPQRWMERRRPQPQGRPDAPHEEPAPHAEPPVGPRA
jgi:GNAT superfamily N-acetyltransferase